MTEKEYVAKMFAEYHELCKMSNGKIITLQRKDYGRLKSTLDVLEMGGYIRNLEIDGGYIYAIDESFEYFEINMRAELGISTPMIIGFFSDSFTSRVARSILSKNSFLFTVIFVS